MVKRSGVRADIEMFDVQVGGETLVVISLPVGGNDALGGLLTAAEAEVAHDAVGGLSNAEIATRRGTSTRTVANQLASIYRKLDVGSRAELAVRLLEVEE